MKKLLVLMVLFFSICVYADNELVEIKHDYINVPIDYEFCINRTIKIDDVKIIPIYSNNNIKLLSARNIDKKSGLTYSFVDSENTTYKTKNKEVAKQKINTKKGNIELCFKANESGYISYEYDYQGYVIKENSTWINITYKWKKDIDCRFFNGYNAIINGSGGFSVNGSQEFVWITCEPNLSLYYNDKNDYDIYNATSNISWDVELGNGTGRNGDNVWKNYIMVFHGNDITQDLSGKGNGFACTNCPVSDNAYGYIGKGWYFDGNDVLSMSYNSSQDIGSNLAYMYIIKPLDDDGGRVLYRRNGEKGYSSYIYGSAYSNKQNFFTGSTTFGSLESNANTIINNEWNVIFNSYNTSRGRITIKNSTLVGSDSVTGQLANPSSATLYFGAKDPASAEAVNAYIDEFRMFNGCRTQTELENFGKNIAGIDGYGTINETIAYEEIEPNVYTYIYNESFISYDNNVEIYFIINGSNATYNAQINYSNSTDDFLIRTNVLNNTLSYFNISSLSYGLWYYNITGFINDSLYNVTITSNFTISTSTTTTTSASIITTTLGNIKAHYQDFTFKAYLRCCKNNTCQDVESMNYTYIDNDTKCFDIGGSEQINTISYIMQNIYLIIFIFIAMTVIFIIVNRAK